MNLSKSKYTRYCQCPKMLWMDTYKKEEAVQDPALLRRFAEGHEVGDLAKNLLGGYVDATALKDDGSPDIGQMLENTRNYVANNMVNICEAAFSVNGCYCAVDILHKNGDGYEIYEVKSSTDVSEVYLIDVAYQKYVLESGGVKITGTYIVHIDNSYVRQGDIDIHKLFKIVDVSDEIAPYYAEVAAKTAEAKAYLKQKTEPVMPIGGYCSKPYDCAYFGYCTRNIPQPNVFDLYRMNFDKACDYINGGIITLSDILISGEHLSEKQRIQAETAVYDLPPHIDRLGIKSFLNELWYPLYFLDFETFKNCVPLYDGQKPYQQVPFQYSLHYITEEYGELQHREFLADEMRDPRRDIAESLVANIPTDACVLAYNKSFECTRIKELAAMFPDLSATLLKIESNIRDLLDVFRNGYVYNKAMGGSFSIKSVLPAMFPDNPDLNYHNLEDVHNGGEATDTYLSLRGMQGEERDHLRQSLLAYCKLDTMAMVMIWQKLRELCAEK